MKILVLAGGSGTRLWPLSRQKKPKQFQKLISKKTLFQDTLDRIKFIGPKNIFIATGKEYEKEVRTESRKYKIPKENFIIETARKDTAACIGLAAIVMSKKTSPKEVMAVIYADHLVRDVKEFRKLLKIAEKIAQEEDTLNIIEVKARFPNVHLGYVKIGKLLREINGAEIYSFEKFIEKPDLEKAKKFLTSYKYLWNTGFYVWKIAKILEKFQQHMPQTYRELEKISHAIRSKNEHSEKPKGLKRANSLKIAIEKHYKKCEKISIDYGIMEKVSKHEVRIIPAELGWSDIGTWESIYDELTEENEKNLVKANTIEIDTKGSIIYGHDSKLIATIGIEDLVIVDTKDTLLVCHKGRSQEVKKIVEQLQEKGLQRLL